MAETCVTFVVGARPNFMKVAPVYRSLAADEQGCRLCLIHTGQHYDAVMSDVFLEELGLPVPHRLLGVGSGTHGEQTARALLGVESALLDDRPDLLVVPGDVNSTLAATLAAVKLGIPVAHLEAGLRSRDWTMPEEHNRVLTDHASSLLLAHSQSAVENLVAEGIDPGRIELVGNTMIDSLLASLERARASTPWASYDTSPGEYVLVTLHRPALVDHDPMLLRATDVLIELAASTAVVFPVHPRTRANLERLDRLSPLADGGVRVAAPVGYLEFVGLESAAAAVITDSGGVQEETSALGIPCVTLRETTERPVTVELGTNVVIGLDPEGIPAALQAQMTRVASTGVREIPLWDGAAGPRAAAAIREAALAARR